jgi:uncharacterized protein YjbJ (UPF0337 family)
MTKRKHGVAAEKLPVNVVVDQSVAYLAESEKKSAAAPAEAPASAGVTGGKRPDNNKRLAELEQGASVLGLALQGFLILPSEDAFAASSRLLGELRARQAVQTGVDAQTSLLVGFLGARPDFSPKPDESAAEALIRLVGDLDGRIAAAGDAAGAKQAELENLQTELADLQERHSRAGGQLDRLSGFLSEQPGFIADDHELSSEAAVRCIVERGEAVDRLTLRVEQLEPANAALTEQLAAEGAARAAAETRVEDLTESLKNRAKGEADKALAKLAPPPLPHPVDLEEVPVFTELPADAALTLRFTDGIELVDTPAPSEVGRGEIELFGGRGVLNRTIELSPTAPPTAITTAWLVAEPVGDAPAKACRCELAGVLRFGGGQGAKLPGGHLIF